MSKTYIRQKLPRRELTNPGLSVVPFFLVLVVSVLSKLFLFLTVLNCSTLPVTIETRG